MVLASSNSKVIENDLLIFLQFYFVSAVENIEKILKDITLIKKSLNFWLNFALNFKDKSFIELIQSNVDAERGTFIKKKLKEIIQKIANFLEVNLLTKEKYSQLIEQNLFEFLEIIIRFDEMFENIAQTTLNELLDPEIAKTFNTCLQNLANFSNLPLTKIKKAFYEKVGYAFLDFKGNFCKLY